MCDHLSQALATVTPCCMDCDLDAFTLKLSLVMVNATGTNDARTPSRLSCLTSEAWGPSLCSPPMPVALQLRTLAIIVI